MTKKLLAALAALAVLSIVPAAVAHEGEDHHKCKKGYVMTDDHKCVKAPQ